MLGYKILQILVKLVPNSCWQARADRKKSKE